MKPNDPRLYDLEINQAIGFFPSLDVRNASETRNIFNALLNSTALIPGHAGVRFHDQTIPGPTGDPDVPIRIYVPQTSPKIRPAFVSFHGGAFILGNLESEHKRCLKISAECDAIVIAVDYRLAPENPFPAGLLDCYAALEWVADNADVYGIDRRKIVIGGSSSGGCLTAAVALLARDRNGPKTALQMLFYPVLDDRCDTDSMKAGFDCPVWSTQNSIDMWSHYIGDDRSQVSSYAAPARQLDLSGLPPAYILTCEHDPLRDEALNYALRLMAAGVSVELHNVPGAVHGFDLLISSALSERVLSECVAAFKGATR